MVAPSKIEKISDKIIHVQYERQEDLAAAFVRLQEYYESPEFKDKIFTFGQFRKWYAETFGAWTYLKDWQGFNVPASAFAPFVQGLFDPLMENEKILVDLFRGRTDGFYVIGTYEGCDEPGVFEHEVCHALYRTVPNYRFEVDEYLRTIPSEELAPVVAKMVNLGYNKSVVWDEVHAYLCESSSFLKDEKIPFKDEWVSALKKIKEKYVR